MSDGLLGSNPVPSGTDVPQMTSPLLGTPFDMESTALAFNQNAAAKAAEERAKKAQGLMKRGQQPFAGVRNPAIQKAIGTIFNEATSAQTFRPASFTATTRNAAQAKQIGALGQQVDQANTQAATSLTEFVKQQLANRPAVQKAVQQETDALGAIYNQGPGGVQSQLAQQGRANKAAINQAVAQAMNRARRGDSMRRMTGGNSSYNDAVYGDVLGRIAADSALRTGEIDRNNLLYLLAQREGNVGKRSRLLDDMARRELATGEAYRRDASDRVGLTSGLMNLENANTRYDFETPETRLLRAMGLIDDLGDLDFQMQRYEYA